MVLLATIPFFISLSMFNRDQNLEKFAVFEIDTKMNIKYISDVQNIILKSSWQRWYCILSNSLILMKIITISLHRVFHIGCPHGQEYFV